MDTWLLLFIAVTNLATAILYFIMRRDVSATRIASEKTELNTNSMREQLVNRTAEASDAAGHARGVKEGEEKAADVARGVLQGQKT